MRNIAFSPAPWGGPTIYRNLELDEGKANKKAITDVVLTLLQEAMDASVTASVPDEEQEQCRNAVEALHRSRGFHSAAEASILNGTLKGSNVGLGVEYEHDGRTDSLEAFPPTRNKTQNLNRAAPTAGVQLYEEGKKKLAKLADEIRDYEQKCSNENCRTEDCSGLHWHGLLKCSACVFKEKCITKDCPGRYNMSNKCSQCIQALGRKAEGCTQLPAKGRRHCSLHRR